MRCLALVVAREGSKGLPGKNLATLGDLTLVQWSLEFADQLVKLGLVSDAFFSTDSCKMAKFAEGSNVRCPELRPALLSGDFAKTSDVALHVNKFYEEQYQLKFDYVLLLQATSPFRKIETIQKMLELAEFSNAESVITCRELHGIYEPYVYRNFSEQELILLSSRDLSQVHRRQEAKKIYVRTGTAYLTKVEYLKATEKIVNDHPKYVTVDDQQAINIDTQNDLENARQLL